MNRIFRVLCCLLGLLVIALTSFVQMGLRLFYWLCFALGFLLFVFLILFMLLGHLPPLSPKLAVIWGAWFQMLTGFSVLFMLDLGPSLIQGRIIAWMSYRK